MRVSFIIPTRNRKEELSETVTRLGELDLSLIGHAAELIVADNASDERVQLPDSLENGLQVRVLHLQENRNTGARNDAARDARGDWLVMLDDDSAPLAQTDWSVLEQFPATVAAVGGEIMLPSGKRESGGLPEVVVGCGCAIRRSVFLEAGGYDAGFGYYAEEYDLCARLIGMGYVIAHSRSLKFLHRKSHLGRDFNEILYRLVRNNAWVMQRYAPELTREGELAALFDRYREIASREGAMCGYERAMLELNATLDQQIRMPLSDVEWDRFTGRAAVRGSIRDGRPRLTGAIRLIGEPLAKGRGIIKEELLSAGFQIGEGGAGTAMIGVLSPGPMLDLHDQHPEAALPWRFEVGVGLGT
ncbi:MAG: glycosyltransferase family 2 protein [Phycisphaerales bacterium]